MSWYCACHAKYIFADPLQTPHACHGFWRRGSREGSGEGLEALVQSQVSFNRVPEKVWEALVQSHVRFNRICGHLIHGNPAEVFPALGFAARFRKICKNKTLRLLGIPSKLIFLLVEKTLRTSAFPSVHIVGSFTSKLLSTDMYMRSAAEGCSFFTAARLVFPHTRRASRAHVR